MSTDYRDRIMKAVEKYSKKNDPSRVKRRNKAPEKEVVKELLTWLRAGGFDVQVIESKATFSQQHQRFISQSTKAGTCDISGCSPQGYGVYIEAKAPGKISTLSMIQENYLKSKIERGAFAVCVDSVDRLETIYKHWLIAKNKSVDVAKQYLLNVLSKNTD